MIYFFATIGIFLKQSIRPDFMPFIFRNLFCNLPSLISIFKFKNMTNLIANQRECLSKTGTAVAMGFILVSNSISFNSQLKITSIIFSYQYNTYYVCFTYDFLHLRTTQWDWWNSVQVCFHTWVTMATVTKDIVQYFGQQIQDIIQDHDSFDNWNINNSTYR